MVHHFKDAVYVDRYEEQECKGKKRMTLLNGVVLSRDTGVKTGASRLPSNVFAILAVISRPSQKGT
jgi:hypothetical protein